MVLLHNVKTYEEFINLLEELKVAASEHSVYIYFTSSITDTNDQSWCPSCNAAWSVIQKCLDHVNPQAIFIKAEVGSKEEWESKNNPFKMNSRYKVKVLPTLLHWKSYQRLEGAYCAKPDIVELLFDESEAVNYTQLSMSERQTC
ncbi:thioredoxin domain-containing protein 17-like [Leptinotarsa decemlineata]|uniref:thioredoxin domain-containing protein 17-like n=1 Tax=Leptinotarsa decemlineata TaxID=7539 RepID=UPI000C2533BF|nr:thioredoxin domain-containing protein 17-like [Leptinotarsa decemlineata]